MLDSINFGDACTCNTTYFKAKESTLAIKAEIHSYPHF